MLVAPATRAPKALQSIPLVVLTDEETASAAEVFAGAIRDHCRGLVVGEHSGPPGWKSWSSCLSHNSRTWGKGTVQTPITLSDAGKGTVALLVSSARLQTPTGGRIDGCGLRLEHAAILNRLGSKSKTLGPPWLFKLLGVEKDASSRTGHDVKAKLSARLKLCQSPAS